MTNDRLREQVHPAHAEVWEILPWYHQGALSAAARLRVDAHLGECLVCTREVRRLRQLHVAIAAPADDHACTQAFLRLSAQLHGRRRSWRSRLRGWLDALAAPAPLLAGAGVAAICALLVFGPLGPQRDGAAPTVPTPFLTLGRQDRPSAEVGHPLLRIVVRGAEHDGARSAWLGRNGAELIEGPSAIGVMTVKVALDGRHLSEVLERMRTDEDTLFVEPLNLIGERPDRRR